MQFSDQPFFLTVTDPTESIAVNFRLGINQGRSVVLHSEFGTSPLVVWDLPIDTPRLEKQSDGLSIRVGFKRFLIATHESEQAVENWMKQVSVENKTETTNPSPGEQSINLGSQVIRFKELLDSGAISREEFDLLIAGIASKSIDHAVEQKFQQQAELENQKQALALHEQQLYDEFLHFWNRALEGTLVDAGYWMTVLGKGSSMGNPPNLKVPSTPDEVAVRGLFMALKRRIEECRSDPDSLLVLSWVVQGSGINLVNRPKYEAEIAKCIKKGRPLPGYAQKALHLYIGQVRSHSHGLREFARKMQWDPMPEL